MQRCQPRLGAPSVTNNVAIYGHRAKLRAVELSSLPLTPIEHAIFGMGTWETMIILVIALVFLGPDKLPEVARSIGKGLRMLRRAMSSVEYEVRSMTEPERYTPPRRPHASEVSAQHATETTEGHPDDPHGVDPHAPPDDYDFHREPAEPTKEQAPVPAGSVAAAHPLRPPLDPAQDEQVEQAAEGEAETS